MTSRHPITARGVLFSAGEKVHELKPLAPVDAARLLVRRAPRRVAPDEIGCPTFHVFSLDPVPLSN